MRLIVWGAGELGSRVLALAAAYGLEGIGYTRTDKRHEQLRQARLLARKGSPAKQLREDDALLFAIAGSAQQYEAIVSLKQPCPQIAVLISSVGYYGQPNGPVDEQTPAGTTEHALRVAKTETVFRAWAGERGIIVRLGGLYRPGRGPFAVFKRRGTVPLGPPDRTLALIHYEDAAQASFAAFLHKKPEPVYLGVTPPCPSREAFYRAASSKAGLPDTVFASPLNQPLVEYDVSQLRRDLLPKPVYPDWHSALE